MADIFLSYAREDETRIQSFVDELEKQGWSVFWDRHIPAGKTWRSYIATALDDAKCVIVVWSSHSITSTWVSEEADVGQHQNILVPVILDSVKPPIGFRSIQTANLSDWQPNQPSQHFDKLVRDISGILNSPATPDINEQTEDPKPDKSRSSYKSSEQQTIIKSKRFVILVVAILFVLVASIGYLSYKMWFANVKQSQPQGLVFATKIETNGQAIDPNTTFPPDITDLYAVFRSDMAPPGMEINVENPIKGKYYAYLKVSNVVKTSKFGWRWYQDGKEANYYEMDVKSGDGVWLQRFNYDGPGIFGGEELSPGKYTIVILLGGNPAMSSELIILSDTEEAE